MITSELRIPSPTLKRRHTKPRETKVKLGKFTETEVQQSVQTTTRIGIISKQYLQHYLHGSVEQIP